MMNRKDDHSSLCLVVVAEHNSNNAKEQQEKEHLDRNNNNGVNIHKDHEEHDEDSSASEEFEPIPYTTKNTSSVVVGLDDGGGDEEDEVELPYQEYNQKRDEEQGNRKTAAVLLNEKIHNVSSTRMRRSSASITVSSGASPSKEGLNKNDDQSSKPSWCPKTKKLLCDLLFELDPTHDSNSFPAGEEQKEQGVVEEAHHQEQDQNQLRGEDYGGRAGDEATPLVSSLHYSNRSRIPLYYNPNNYSHSYYYHAPFNHTYSWSMQESSSSYAEVGSTSSTAGQINDADDSSAFCHDSATSTTNTSHRHETNNHYCCYSYGGQEDNKSKNSYYDGDEEQQRKGSEQHRHWNKLSGDDSKHCQEINLHPPLYHDHHTALNPQQFYTTPIFTSNITTPSITLPPDSIDGNYYSQQHSFYDSSAILVGNQHYHYDESSFPASQYHGYSDIEYHRQQNLNLRVSDIVEDQQFLPSRSSDGDNNDTTQDADGQQMKSWHTPAEYNFNSKNISPDLYCTTRGTSQDCSLSQHQHGEEHYGNEQQEGDAEKCSLKRKASNISQSQHRTDAMLSAIPQKLRKISNESSIRITSSAPLDDTFNTSMYDAVSGDSHYIPQTSTTDTTDNVQHDCQYLPVVTSSDKKYATKYSYRVMKEVTLAYFDESDRRGKRQNIPVGFPGLACKHCHGVRTAPQAELNDLNLPLYQRTGRYFPSTLKSFSDTKKTLNAIFSHLMRCQKCPREVKQKLVQLEKEHSSERAAKNYGSQSRFFLRIWHRIHKTETSNSVS